MNRRGRRIGMGAGAVAVVILAGLAFALRGRIAEEWHIYRLRTGDARVKEHAARRLEELSSTRTPYLIHCLRKGDERCFPACVEGLVRAGADAVGPLVEIVRDVSIEHKIRRHAAEALGKIGKPAWSGAPALLEYLRELEYDPGMTLDEFIEVEKRAGRKGVSGLNPASCSSVILALGGMDPRDSEVIATLAASLGGAMLHVRLPAVEALARLAPDAVEGIPALARALEAPALDNVREAEFRSTVAHTLARFGPQAAPAIAALCEALQDQWRKVRSGAAEALGAIGPGAAEAVPDLEALIADRDEFVREAAAAALRRIRL